MVSYQWVNCGIIPQSIPQFTRRPIPHSAFRIPQFTDIQFLGFELGSTAPKIVNFQSSQILVSADFSSCLFCVFRSD
jgi:hypothetical protein